MAEGPIDFGTNRFQIHIAGQGMQQLQLLSLF